MSSNQQKSKRKKESKDKNLLIIAVLVIVTVIAVSVGLYFSDSSLINPFGADVEESVVAKLKENSHSFDLNGFENLEDPNSYDQTDFLLVDGGLFKPGIEVVRVGNEILTTDDFNNYFFVYDQGIYYGTSQLNDEKMIDAYLVLNKESTLLQEYYERYELGENVLFKDSQREAADYFKRAEAIGTLQERFHLEHVNSVKGEVLSIWFNNILEPPVGAELAQEYSLLVITDLRERIANAEITMQEAADEILADPELVSYDFSINANVYNRFVSEGGSDVFNAPELNEALSQMRAGELSDVILSNDTQNGQDYYPAFYSIIFVEEISGDGMTLDEVYENSVFKDDVEVL